MNNKLNDIDLIIRQKLTKFSPQEADSKWSFIGNKLSFYNFFKFGFYHLNVYYFVLLTSLASASSYMFVQNYKLKTHIKYLENTINSIKKKEVSTPVLKPLDNGIKIEPIVVRRTDFHFSDIKKEIKSEDGDIKKSDILVADTVKSKTKPSLQISDSVITDLQTTKRIVKKKVYIKNSPVIIRDTVLKHKTKH
jgi:hypothetical protein